MKKTLSFLLLAVLTLASVNSFAQTVISSEDFQSGALPASWTQETLATDGGWLVGDANAMSSAYFPIPDHTVFACTNDDECNCDKSNDFLKTGVFDLSTYSAVVLEYDYFFYAATYSGATEVATVKISVDGGTTWTDLEDVAGAADWTTHQIDISAYAGNSSVMIGFHYNDGGGWLYGFCIDNFKLFEPLAYDAAVLSNDMAPFVMPGSFDVTGTFKNVGAETITSIDVNYSIDGGAVNTYNLTGLNVDMLAEGTYTHDVQASFATSGTYEVKVWLSNPNGNADLNNTNDTIVKTINVLDQIADKLVLVEHFTQASCAPCASQNPALDALITSAQNIDRVTHIAYHTSWPGVDPMYDFNVTNGMGDARVSYYDVTGVPDCVIAGNQGQGLPSIVTQDAIDNEDQRPGLFNITGTATATGSDLAINIDVEAYSDFPSGEIVAHVVLVEEVNYTSAPGSNGETYFPDVMRQMFPDVDGTDLGHPVTGDITNLTFNYTIQSPIDINNAHLVVFVQNNADKDVYMATRLPITIQSAVNELAKDEISIYPNPSNGLVNISNVKDATINVYNSLGQLVHSVYSNGDVNSIDLSAFGTGSYLVNIVTEKGSLSKKVIITE